MTAEEVKESLQLRPYFISFVSRNIALGLSDVFKMNHADRSKFQKEFHDAHFLLCEELKRQVNEEDLSSIIEEVSLFYLSAGGRVGHKNSLN